MKGIWRAATCGLVGGILILAGGVNGAVAEDDDDTTFDQKFFNGMLSTLGLRSGSGEIEYRERSPLVVPPKADLPQPQTDQTRAANWPNDPNVKRRKQEAEKRRSGGSIYNEHEDARALRPDELEMGRVLARSGQARMPTDAEKNGSPMKPSELGYGGGVFDSLFGSKKESTPAFTAEPPRSSLTDPPVGYQTPSPTQPYTAKGSKWLPNIPDLFSARE